MKQNQQAAPRKRVWLPSGQLDDCAFVTKNESAVSVKSSKNLQVLFTASGKNPESLRPLASCLGESVYAVSKRLRAIGAEAVTGDVRASSSCSSGSDARVASRPTPPPGAASPASSTQSFTSVASGGDARLKRTRLTSVDAPQKRACSTSGDDGSPAVTVSSGHGRAVSETKSDTSGSEGNRRTRAASARISAAEAATTECASMTRLRTSASPAPSSASTSSLAALDSGRQSPLPSSTRTRRRTAQGVDAAEATHKVAPQPTVNPPGASGTTTNAAGMVVTRSSRVVRPSRRFIDDNAMLPSSTPSVAPTNAVPPASESPKVWRPAHSSSPSAAGAGSAAAEDGLDAGVVRHVAEYADSVASAADGQSDIGAMLRAQWDGRLKGRGKDTGEGEAAASAGAARHLLRQPKLHLNNRVLKRLRDGRDLTYLSETEAGEVTEPGPADTSPTSAGTGTSTPSGGGGYVTCGVCACRRYVAVPQLCYKFGSWACLHCIKFVLSTLKAPPTTPLRCRDDKKSCRVSCAKPESESTDESSESKSDSASERGDASVLLAPDERCSACWLRGCLHALNFSEERHNRLRARLPRSHQAAVPLFCRKERRETGHCELGPLAGESAPGAGAAALPAPQPTPAPAVVAAASTVCPKKAWGAATDAVPGFDALSANSPQRTSDASPQRPSATSPRRPSATSPQRESKADSVPESPRAVNAAVTRRSRAAAADAASLSPRYNVPRKAPPHARKAVTVVSLGGGWKRREFVRKGGRLERVVYAPDGCRFRSVVELQAYLRSNGVQRRAKALFTDTPPASSPDKPKQTAAKPKGRSEKPSPKYVARAVQPLNSVKAEEDSSVQAEPKRDVIKKQGPRVKVVCRSASLVLGQPRALFGADGSSQPTEVGAGESRETEDDVAEKGEEQALKRHSPVNGRMKRRRQDEKPVAPGNSRNVLMKLKVLHKYKQLQQHQQSRVRERVRKTRCGVCPGCQAKNCTKCVFCRDMVKYGGPGKLKKSCIRRVCNRPLLPGVVPTKAAAAAAAASQSRLRQAPPPLVASAGAATPRTPAARVASQPVTPAPTPAAAPAPSPLVRLDPWTKCEPEELWRHGVAVIAAQPPSVPVLCFNCASAGQEEMLYCNSCCEPFHAFCLDEWEAPRSAAHQEWWVCGRCAVCTVCGAGDSLQRCHQCSQTYHLSCLSPHACASPQTPDAPWTCVRCARCRSCQKAQIQQYVGNLPLCRNCFRLHQRGNYCPLCGGCYEDDDFDTKMMECESCHTWVHAQCERLSDDMYQILSFLPESVAYLCDRCQPAPSAESGADLSWRRAVRHEFEAGCSGILRAVWACLARKGALAERHKAAEDQVVPSGADTNSAADESEKSQGEGVGPTVRLRQLRNQLRRGDVPSVRVFHRLLQTCIADPTVTAEAAAAARAAYDSALSSTFPWFRYDGGVVTPVKRGVSHPDHPYAAGGGGPASAMPQHTALPPPPALSSPTELRRLLSPGRLPRTPLRHMTVAAAAAGHEQFRALIDLCNKHYQSLRAREAGRPADARRCGLCRRCGEATPAAGRLLWAGGDQWLHAGCLLHSDAVFEEVDGTLRAVLTALQRGRAALCAVCGQRGATVGCGHGGCAHQAHLPCAAEAGWTFASLAACVEHQEPDGDAGPDPVRRRVLLEPEQFPKPPPEAALSAVTAVIGSLTVHSFGDQVVPSGDQLLPVGMTCSRVYWSTVNPRRRTVYTVRTVSAGGAANGADTHYVIDHSAGHTEVARALQQLEEWRRGVAARGVRPLVAPYRSATRIAFDAAAAAAAGDPAADTELVKSDHGAGDADDWEHEQQVSACLDSLLNSVCRSVVEEEEKMLADANLNIPILETVDHDFITMMLNELCEGDGAGYLSEAGTRDEAEACGGAGSSGGREREELSQGLSSLVDEHELPQPVSSVDQQQQVMQQQISLDGHPPSAQLSHTSPLHQQSPQQQQQQQQQSFTFPDLSQAPCGQSSQPGLASDSVAQSSAVVSDTCANSQIGLVDSGGTQSLSVEDLRCMNQDTSERISRADSQDQHHELISMESKPQDSPMTLANSCRHEGEASGVLSQTTHGFSVRDRHASGSVQAINQSSNSMESAAEVETLGTLAQTIDQCPVDANQTSTEERMAVIAESLEQFSQRQGDLGQGQLNQRQVHVTQTQISQEHASMAQVNQSQLSQTQLVPSQVDQRQLEQAHLTQTQLDRTRISRSQTSPRETDVSEVSSSQPTFAPDWPAPSVEQQRTRHRSQDPSAGYQRIQESVSAGYQTHPTGPAGYRVHEAGYFADCSPFSGALLGSSHASAFRPAGRSRPRSVSAAVEQPSYEELLERLAVKPVAAVVPEPRGEHLWPPDLRTYSAQVHYRRRSSQPPPTGCETPPVMYPQLYHSWYGVPAWPPMAAAAQDAWQTPKPDHSLPNWPSAELSAPQRQRASKERPPAARSLWQLDGAGDETESDTEQTDTPSKCPKCRRMYRTRESMLKHQGQCDFEVDSSGSSETEEDISEWPVELPVAPRVLSPPPPAPPPAALPTQDTGEAEVSSTTAPELDTPSIKQEPDDPSAPAVSQVSPSRPRRRSPKKRSSLSATVSQGGHNLPLLVSAAPPAAAALQPPACVQPMPQLLMLGGQLVSCAAGGAAPLQLLQPPPQLTQPALVFLQPVLQQPPAAAAAEPLPLYTQPPPYVLNYPQIAMPPGANLQHLGSFEVPTPVAAPSPFVYSAATPGLLTPQPVSVPATPPSTPQHAPSQPPQAAAVPPAVDCQPQPPGSAADLQPEAPRMVNCPPLQAAAAPASLPPPPPRPAPPPPPPTAPAAAAVVGGSSAAAGRQSPVQSCQVDSSRPQSADPPPMEPEPEPAGSPAPSDSVEPAAEQPSSASQQPRKVAKVKPRPTYSYRDAMKTNPVLQQEKGKLMRRLVPSQLGRPSSAANAPSLTSAPTPETSMSAAPAAAEPSTELDDSQKLSYRIRLRRNSSEDSFQVQEIRRTPSSSASAQLPAGAALKSLRITARVGGLGSDVLVVPRQRRASTEVEVSGERAAEQDAESDKENQTGAAAGSRGRSAGTEQTRADCDELTGSSDPPVLYEVTSADGFKFRSPDISEVWRRVFEAVQDARAGMKMKPLTYNPRSVGGLKMLGLTHSGVQFLLEQMPGAEHCAKHQFKFHQPEFGPLRENAHGCARAEGFTGRRPIDMFSWLASEHRKLPEPSSPCEPAAPAKISRRGASLELPMAMRYRRLCDSSRDMVGVYRSAISGRGLFCKRPLDAGQMVIEYAGEVIRSSVTDARERRYSARGIGCYMFRIDDDTVVDATMMGNAARFINHSCNPNCYSRVVDILGKKHIIIFALRRIARGEELTYDYKFPIEEDKIACTCGAKRCRKYLN